MNKIPLSQGMYALVDDDDYEKIAQNKWYANFHKGTYYALRSTPFYLGKRKSIKMHREVMGDIEGVMYDHIDGNGLNNQKSNLRIVSSIQNGMNRGKRELCTSKYKGISWHCRINKWGAQIKFNGKRYWIGGFINEEEAARAYDAKAKELYGEFARINFEDMPLPPKP